MGFGENFRPRLPSRNWTIFLTITGGITAAVIYDKRETRRAQRKWQKVVEHLAKEPIGDSKQMPRKLMVYIEAPPQDGLRLAQDHFKEYVKPVLVASGLDWDFVQGRKEGDVRAELAEDIRKHRMLHEGMIEEDDPVLVNRSVNGSIPYQGPLGDIVVGRHTWKEYIRGLHEGWLGPLVEPPKPIVEAPAPTEAEAAAAAAAADEKAATEKKGEEENVLPGITIHENTVKEDPEPVETPKEEKKPEKKKQPQPWISTADYAAAALPSNLPQEFDPSVPIAQPHILGFLNTHIRMYRFFTRRRLADQIGRDVAAIVLAHSRPYHTVSSEPGSAFAPEIEGDGGVVNDEADKAEQVVALKQEEKEWHKLVHKPLEDLTKERTWTDEMVLDPRIAGRMRRAELSADDEARANDLAQTITEEEVEGWIKRNIRAGYRGTKKYFEKKPPAPADGLVEEDSNKE